MHATPEIVWAGGDPLFDYGYARKVEGMRRPDAERPRGSSSGPGGGPPRATYLLGRNVSRVRPCCGMSNGG